MTHLLLCTYALTRKPWLSNHAIKVTIIIIQVNKLNERQTRADKLKCICHSLHWFQRAVGRGASWGQQAAAVCTQRSASWREYRAVRDCHCNGFLKHTTRIYINLCLTVLLLRLFVSKSVFPINAIIFNTMFSFKLADETPSLSHHCYIPYLTDLELTFSGSLH